MTTYRREVFPGSGLPYVVGGLDTMTDQELLSRLHRAVNLYNDEQAMARDPYAKKGIGHHILSYVNELKRRGFVITQHEGCFLVHPKEEVEIIHGERVELVDEWAMKRRVYWALSDEMYITTKRGDKKRGVELNRALFWLYKQWKVKGVSRIERKLAFGDEPGTPFR